MPLGSALELEAVLEAAVDEASLSDATIVDVDDERLKVLEKGALR